MERLKNSADNAMYAFSIHLKAGMRDSWMIGKLILPSMVFEIKLFWYFGAYSYGVLLLQDTSNLYFI